MKNILSLVVMLMCLLSFADDSMQESSFQNLRTLFKKGVKPEVQKIQNHLWTGSCFAKSSPNDASYSYLYLREQAGEDSENRVYEATHMWNLSASLMYYDGDSFSAALDRSHIVFKEVEVFDNSLAIVNKRESARLRVAGDYLVEEFLWHKKDPTSPSGIKAKVYSMCYYYESQYLP